jgi:UDP-galactopyranose mutase
MRVVADYVVVGSGLTGSTIARVLADAGREVVVIERRTHIGGNVYDHTHPSGIRVHTYGPHYFRTSCDHVWDFVNRFAPFYPYEAEVLTRVDGSDERWPVTEECIRRIGGPDWRPAFFGSPSNLEEAALSLMPRRIYEMFVKEYNEKQWGLPATRLSNDLCKRFDVRRDGDARLTPHAKYQGIPSDGYAALMSELLRGVPVIVNVDYLQQRESCNAKRLLVFTGPIDEFFGFETGHLAYRAQQRRHEYMPHVSFALPCGQVNNPLHAGGPHIRVLEWKHMLPEAFAKRISGTVLTYETPCTPADPTMYEYPFPDETNRATYRKYRARADADAGVLICGRLGEYQYLDMDQAITRALRSAQAIVDGGETPNAR